MTAKLILVSSQQMSQEDLRKLLSEVQDTEKDKRRELSSASEELAVMSARHMRELEDLDAQLRKRDREKRGLEEELRESREELSRDRETIRELRVSPVDILLRWQTVPREWLS